MVDRCLQDGRGAFEYGVYYGHRVRGQSHVTASLLHGQKMAVMSLLVPVSTRGRARAHTVSDTGTTRTKTCTQRVCSVLGPYSPLLASGFL